MSSISPKSPQTQYLSLAWENRFLVLLSLTSHLHYNTRSIITQSLFSSAQGCFMNSPWTFLPFTFLLVHLPYRFWWADHVKSANYLSIPLQSFFRGILYKESIQTGYALKHILFSQSGIVTKAVHHFCHYICQTCLVPCHAQDVVCVFSDEWQIVSEFLGPANDLPWMCRPAYDGASSLLTSAFFWFIRTQLPDRFWKSVFPYLCSC